MLDSCFEFIKKKGSNTPNASRRVKREETIWKQMSENTLEKNNSVWYRKLDNDFIVTSPFSAVRSLILNLGMPSFFSQWRRVVFILQEQKGKVRNVRSIKTLQCSVAVLYVVFFCAWGIHCIRLTFRLLRRTSPSPDPPGIVYASSTFDIVWVGSESDTRRFTNVMSVPGG